MLVLVGGYHNHLLLVRRHDEEVDTVLVKGSGWVLGSVSTGHRVFYDHVPLSYRAAVCGSLKLTWPGRGNFYL